AGFSHKVVGPNGSPTFFVLESRGYALFSPFPAGADRLKTLDPTSWRGHLPPGANLSAKVRLSEIPQPLKGLVHKQMQAQAEQPKARRPGENDAAYEGRMAGQALTGDAIRRLVDDGDELSLDLFLNRRTSEVALELALTARPGTTMAKSLDDF